MYNISLNFLIIIYVLRVNANNNLTVTSRSDAVAAYELELRLDDFKLVQHIMEELEALGDPEEDCMSKFLVPISKNRGVYSSWLLVSDIIPSLHSGFQLICGIDIKRMPVPPPTGTASNNATHDLTALNPFSTPSTLPLTTQSRVCPQRCPPCKARNPGPGPLTRSLMVTSVSLKLLCLTPKALESELASYGEYSGAPVEE